MNARLAFESLLSESLVERLGWLLVHSLWQFALVALLAGATVRALRRNSARARYGVLVVAMMMAVALPVATGLLPPGDAPHQPPNQRASTAEQDAIARDNPRGPILLEPEPAPRLADNPLLAGNSEMEGPARRLAASRAASEARPAPSPQTPVTSQPAASWSERARTALRPWLAWIVGGWSFGVVLCSFRPLLGWHTLRRLRRVGVAPASDEVLAAMRRVSERLGLRHAVEVMQSTLAQVPVLVGYFRPVILLPVSLVTTIPAAQLEAILAHELAHDQRHDFVVNLLQTLVETLFFYHPAVWWLSRQIRVEREHCCDDRVVSLLGNRVEYGRALIAIEQRRGRNSVLALGAGDGSLLARIRRIVSLGSDHAAHERWPAALIGLALIGVTFALSMTWSLAANDDPEKEPRPVKATLPGNVTIELMGVTHHTSTSEPESGWWTPGGNPLAEGRIERNRLRGKSAPENHRIFVVETRGVSETSDVRVAISPAGKATSFSSWGGTSVGRTPDPTTFTTAGPFIEANQTSVRVLLATDDWGPVQEVSTSATRINELQLQPEYARCYDNIGPQRVHEQVPEQAVLTIGWPRNQDDLAAHEVWAVDQAGKRHEVSGTAGPLDRREFSFQLPLARVARFEYRLRPYRHRVTFENVSLQPGHRTDVKVSTDSVPVAKPQHYVAILPDGLKVEFAGITTNTAPAREGWRPDGGKMGDLPEWPKGLFLYGGNVTASGNPDHQPLDADGRDFLFEFQGLRRQPSIDFMLPGNGVNFLHDPVKDLHRLRVSTRLGDESKVPGADVDPPADEVRVGLTDELWGTWLQISATGEILNPLRKDDLYPSNYSQIRIQRVGLSQANPNRTFLVLRQPKRHWHLYAFEMRGIDTDGQECWVQEWQSQGVEGTDLDESEWGLSQPLADGKQFARFEYRLRPYRHWVTFKGVSLKPGRETDVKVTVDSPPAAPARLRMRNANGSPAEFNDVVTATVGYPKSSSSSWVGSPSRDGTVLLENLPADAYWLLAAGNLEQWTPFKVKLPFDQPILEQHLRAKRTWARDGIDVKSSFQIDDKEGEVIVIEIRNQTTDLLNVSEEDVQILAGAQRAPIRGLSPKWRTADFPSIRIEPGQTGRLRLDWRNWVGNGLWAPRTEPITEPELPPREPGKVWVRLHLGNREWALISVTDPIDILAEAEAKASAAFERWRAPFRNLRDDDVEKFVLEKLRTPCNPDPAAGTWQREAYEMQMLSSLSMVRQQDRAVKALLKVVDRTEKSESDQRRLAMLYLGGAAPRQVVPLLITALEGAGLAPANGFSPFHEMEALGRIGEEARDAAPVLITFLDSPDVAVRAEAIQALVKVGPSSTAAMNAIAARFDDPSEQVRSRAIYEGGRYGELAKTLGPKFVKLLDSTSRIDRIWAAQALVKSGYREARGFGVLIANVAKGTPEERSAAATALAALGSQAQSMIPKLRAYENDPVERVAKEVRDAIRRIERDDRIFTHAEEAAKNAAPRKASEEALSRLRAATEQPVLHDGVVEGKPATPEQMAETVRPLLPSIVTGVGKSLGEDFPQNLIQSDLPLPLGEGGSLMVTEKGEPLGIWVATRAGKTRANFAVPLTDVLPLLAKAVPPAPVVRGSPDPASPPAEGLPKPDDDTKDPFERRVSLAADGMPLKAALRKVAAEAHLDVEFDAAALTNAGLDLDKPVSADFEGQPLAKVFARLIDWQAHPGVFRELRRGKLVITTLDAWQTRVAARLPEWMKPLYNRGLAATLDDHDAVLSLTTSGIMTDELLAKLETLPGLRELYIEATKGITPAGLAHLGKLQSLEKLTLYSVNQEGAGLGDDVLRSVVGLAALRELSIGECGTTDAGAKWLEQLPQLTALDLRQEGRLTDTALQSIATLKRLKSLSLPSYVATERLGRMQFSADGIRRLSGLEELESLQLVGHDVPADALAFPKLTSLSLGNSSVDDSVARRIGQLRDLTHLELSYTGITDAGFKNIASLPKLRRLDISSSRITDAGVEPFRAHQQLEHLSLRATSLTDEALRQLAQIKTLTRLDLHGSGWPGSVTGARFSIAGLAQLKALPGLETLWLTNFDLPGGGYVALKELKQLRELTFMMCNVSDQELDLLEQALPDTSISSATGGGGRAPRKFREATRKVN